MTATATIVNTSNRGDVIAVNGQEVQPGEAVTIAFHQGGPNCIVKLAPGGGKGAEDNPLQEWNVKVSKKPAAKKAE